MISRVFLVLLLLVTAVSAQWVAESRSGDVAHFLRTDKVLRYDLASRKWLPEVKLPRAGATAFWADGEGAFIAYGKSIYRYSASYTGEEHLLESDTPGTNVMGLAREGNVLIIADTGHYVCRFDRLDLTTGQIAASVSVNEDNLYMTYNAAKKRLGIVTRYGQIDNYTWLKPDLWPAETYWEGSYFSTGWLRLAKTWMPPDGTKCVSSQGDVALIPDYPAYSEDQGYFAKLPGPVDAAELMDQSAVVSVGKAIYSLDERFQPTGKLVTRAASQALRVRGSSVFLFRAKNDSAAIEVEIQPLSSVTFPVRPPGPATIGNNFPPATVLMDKDGVLLMHAPGSSMISRWSTVTSRYLPGILLRDDAPDRFIYCPETHRIFTIYGNGTIRVVDAVAGAQEKGFLKMEYRPESVTVCDTRLVVSRNSSRWLYDASGDLLSYEGFQDGTYEKTAWDPVRKRLYYGMLGMDVVTDDNQVLDSVESPEGLGRDTYYPMVRVSPDGQWILSSNRIYNADGLGEVNFLGRRGFDYANIYGASFELGGSRLLDAIWDGPERLVTVEYQYAGEDKTVVGEWKDLGFHQGAASTTLRGVPVSIHRVPDGFLVLTRLDNVLHFTRLRADLTIISTKPAFPVEPPPVGKFWVVAKRSDAFDLKWNDVQLAASYRIDYKFVLPGSENYSKLSTVNFRGTATARTLSGLIPDRNYLITLVGLKADGSIAWRRSLRVKTAPVAGYPFGGSYDLRADGIFKESILLAWNDQTASETHFRVTRSDPGGKKTIVDVPANTTSLRVTGLAARTSYTFSVQAWRGNVAGDPGSPFKVKTGAENPLPDAPFIDRVSIDGGKVAITIYPSRNEEGFILERSLDKEPRKWQEVGRGVRNQLVFEDATALAGYRYAYRIVAYNDYGTAESEYGSYAEVSLVPGGSYVGVSDAGAGKRVFAMRYPPRIETYDFQSGTWLPPIHTGEPVRSLALDDQGIVAVEGETLVTFQADGSGRKVVTTDAERADSLFIMDGKICFHVQPALDRSHRLVQTPRDGSGGYELMPYTRAPLDYGSGPRSLAPVRNEGGRSIFVAGSELGLLRYPAETGGTPVWSTQSNYSWQGGIYLSSDGAWVMTRGGLRYSNALVYQDQPVLPFDDAVAGPGGILVARRGERLDIHGADFTIARSLDLTEAPVAMDVRGDQLYLFYEAEFTPQGIRVEIIPLETDGQPLAGVAKANLLEADPGTAASALGSGSKRELSGSSVAAPRITSDAPFQIEMPVQAGSSYTVEYSPDLIHWKASPVPMMVDGASVRWTDDGPPAAETPEEGETSRFYRVKEVRQEAE